MTGDADPSTWWGDADLESAWKAVLREVGHDAIPDVLRYEDAKLTWSTLKDVIASDLSTGRIEPQTPQVVEVPKDEFMSRPIARLSLRDRVVYDLMVAPIRQLGEKVLDEHVFSARYNSKGRRRKSGVGEWTLFQAKGRELYERYDSAFMLSTDVSSYFEYVEIALLIRELKALGVANGLADCLSGFLNGLVRISPVWGLPQGPEASSTLGNLYLQPVDALIGQYGAEFIRYQDDIKIFSNSPDHLRVVLRNVLGVLRGRHLNLSLHKTKLLQGPEILHEFEDTRKDAITYSFALANEDHPLLDQLRPSTVDDLRRLFDEAVSSDSIDVRDVKFTVYRLSLLGDSHAVKWILDHLPEVPYLASHLVQYLSQWMEAGSEIEGRLCTYLRNPSENLYPHSELHVVRLFSRSASISADTHSLVWSILRDRNKASYVRQQCARCIGVHSRPGDGPLLSTLLNETNDVDLARAIVVAMWETGYMDKPSLRILQKAKPELGACCQLLISGAKIPPP
jgi:hypothetical protein